MPDGRHKRFFPKQSVAIPTLFLNSVGTLRKAFIPEKKTLALYFHKKWMTQMGIATYPKIRLFNE